MTAREHKKLCRIKVERLAKFITAICVITIVTLIEIGVVSSYVGTVLATTLWFIMPDVSAYILEKKYRIKHNFMTYR